MKEEQTKLGTSEAHRERVQEEFQEIEMIQIRPVINANEVFVVTRPKPACDRQGLVGSWGQDADQAGTFWGVLNASGARLG